MKKRKKNKKDKDAIKLLKGVKKILREKRIEEGVDSMPKSNVHTDKKKKEDKDDKSETEVSSHFGAPDEELSTTE